MLQNQDASPKLSLRSAVLIDGDWLIAASRRLGRNINYHQLADSLRQAFGPITRLLFFASLDEDNYRHKAFEADLLFLGHTVHTAPLVQKGKAVRSKGLDVLLSVTGTALLPDVDQLVLISGDNDFVPLLTEAKRVERSVILISFPFASSRALAAAADRVVNLENFLAGTSLVSSNKTISVSRREEEASPPSELYVAKGEHIEPYLFVRSLFKGASQRLIIVDPYVNEQIFEMIVLVPASGRIQIVTDKSKLKPPDYKTVVRKLRLEGRQIEIFHSRDVHDRFVKVNSKWWHSGHTLKDLGTKDSVIKKLGAAASAKAEKRLTEYLSTAEDLCPLIP